MLTFHVKFYTQEISCTRRPQKIIGNTAPLTFMGTKAGTNKKRPRKCSRQHLIQVQWKPWWKISKIIGKILWNRWTPGQRMQATSSEWERCAPHQRKCRQKFPRDTIHWFGNFLPALKIKLQDFQLRLFSQPNASHSMRWTPTITDYQQTTSHSIGSVAFCPAFPFPDRSISTADVFQTKSQCKYF